MSLIPKSKIDERNTWVPDLDYNLWKIFHQLLYDKVLGKFCCLFLVRVDNDHRITMDHHILQTAQPYQILVTK